MLLSPASVATPYCCSIPAAGLAPCIGGDMTLLILSDIHGNWPALKAILAAEPRYSAVAFCGDVVDYGPQPVECLRWITQAVEYSVRGSEDNALVSGARCASMAALRGYSTATQHWHRTLLSEANCNSLRWLPKFYSFEWEERQFLMAHATPFRTVNGKPPNGRPKYLDMDQWDRQIESVNSDFVLVGYTHVQSIRTFGKVTAVNPGSVGLALDHPGKACYAVYRDGHIELKQVPYEVGRTVALLRSAPISKRVVEGLIHVLGYED
jgi:putative phosphoesterase